MKKFKYIFFIIYVMIATVSLLFSKKDNIIYKDVKGMRGVYYHRSSLISGKDPKMEGKNVLFPFTNVLFYDDSFEDQKNWFMKYFKRAIPNFNNIPEKDQFNAFKAIMQAFLKIYLDMWNDNVKILENGCDGKMDKTTQDNIKKNILKDRNQMQVVINGSFPETTLGSSLTVNSYIYQKIPGKPHHSTSGF